MTAFALTLFTLGCTNNAGGTNEPQDHQADEHAGDGHDHGETDHDPAEEGTEVPKVTLDNGKQWIPNVETTEGIARMAALISDHDPATGDAKALKAGLEEEFALIFARCTMTGEAHNQLHNYLLPIHKEMAYIDLSEKVDRDELLDYLGTYGKYFE